MSILSEWKSLKKIKKMGINQVIPFYESLLRAGAINFRNIDFLSQINPKQKKVFLKSLRVILEGNIVEVGCLPQLGMALLASLYFILNGKRVICIFSNILEFNSYSELLKIYKEELGIDIGVKENEASEEKDNSYTKDIVLVEYVRFIKDFYADRDLIKIRPTVAIITEVDLCLYDRRLFLFRKKNLTAIAAVYQTRNNKKSWQDQKEVLDFKETALLFDQVCGLCSLITRQVTKEITKTYKISVKSIAKFNMDASLQTLVFKSRKEKFDVLADDAAKEKNDILIVYYSQEGYHSLIEKFKGLKKSVVLTINNDSDLNKFLNMTGDKKVIGLVQGTLGLDLLAFFREKKVKFILAEHALFLHHHIKFKIFSKKKLGVQVKPLLYISLDDEAAKIYTAGADFAQPFNLIEFIEQKYSTRWMRELIARGILRKIYRLRSVFWDENNPLFTEIFTPSLAEGNKINKMNKEMNKHISGLCFCGSGKKFKDCHGKI